MTEKRGQPASENAGNGRSMPGGKEGAFVTKRKYTSDWTISSTESRVTALQEKT